MCSERNDDATVAVTNGRRGPWRSHAGGGGGGEGEPAADRSTHINTIAGLHMASTVIMTSSNLCWVATLVQLLAFLPASNSCFASGVCGGMGFGGPCMGGLGGIPPIPPPPCAGGM
ncbi:hypothetical protein TELCIR_17438, partial [Teladorsagia circumcincta]